MNDKVKFAVRIHQGGYTFDALKRIWTEADRLGYHSATLYDLLNVPTLECWTTLSALASVTERIRLTPLTLANPYRPPALLAKMASTLDVISGGRLELGIGAGGGRDDHLASGYEFPSTPTRTRMLDEAVEIIKRLWTERSVDFNGRYYSLKGAGNEPKPVQQPRPPVLIGGRGEAYVLRSVAKHADYCNWGFDMTLEEHQAKWRVLQQHCEAIGRPSEEIQITHNTRVIIAEDQSRFDRMVAERAQEAGMSPEDYRQSLTRAVAGTPEQCIERIEQYVAGGIKYFFLLFPDPISTESLRLFAEEVMPHFDRR